MADRGRPKGTPKTGGGSRKGVPNKINGDLKQMILSALDQAGGSTYLLDQSALNPGPFLSLVGKILPRDVTLTGSVDIKLCDALMDLAKKGGAE